MGRLTDAAGTPEDGAWTAWDQWVADRVARRDGATSEVLQASGLTAPIPGMAEMAGQGTFFPCAPYGTCWEPNTDAAGEQPPATRPNAQSEPNRPSVQPRIARGRLWPRRSGCAARLSRAGPGSAAQPQAQTQPVERQFRFPCIPLALRYRTMKDAATGRQTVVSAGLVTPEPYDWAVCHAGSWVRHHKHYVWVAGGKRRHIDPVRWVKSGRQIAFTPLHPFDVKGQPAINARHWVFCGRHKQPAQRARGKFSPGTAIEYLKAPPREFRTALPRPLAAAETPRMEARAFPALAQMASLRSSAPPSRSASTSSRKDPWQPAARCAAARAPPSLRP